MRKADREKFYMLVDEMKELIDTNNIMSKKDCYKIINELIVLKLRIEDQHKIFH